MTTYAPESSEAMGDLGTIKASILNVTPLLAEQLLSHNPRNRKVNQLWVEHLTSCMERGAMMFTGESIILGTDGRLLDGQHRLHAVVRSGVTTPFVVVFGVDPAAQDAMDVGKSRKVADMISMDGIRYHHAVASAARLALGYPKVNNNLPVHRSRAEEAAYVREHAEALEEAATFAYAHQMSPGSIPVGMLTAAIFIAGDREPVVKRLIEDAHSGVGLSEDSPALALARWCILQSSRRSSHARGTRSDKWAVLVRAINAAADGKPVKQLRGRVGKDGQLPLLLGLEYAPGLKPMEADEIEEMLGQL